MKIKKTLKKIKSSESTISTFMGIFVVLIVGFLMVKYFQGPGKPSESLPKTTESSPAEESKSFNGEEENSLPSPEPLINLPADHTITKGDNLWKIAEKYYGSGYNWVDIAKENQILNSDKINEGMVLKIPSVKVRVALGQLISLKVTKTPITEEKYQVVKGDSLWNICLRAYGDSFRWPEIAKVNGLKNPSLLYVGTVLTLPR